MALKDTMNHLNGLLVAIMKDVVKVSRGNKTAAQRIRVGTIKLEKIGKTFRKESMALEKGKKSRRFESLKIKRRKRIPKL